MASAAVLPPTASTRFTSSAGLLAMLDEAEVKVKVKALEKLDAVVPDFWAEISDALSEIECLYEDESFPQRGLAALVASKVYYYLGELGDALTYALGAGQLFNVDEGSEYVDTLLAKAIDEYCGLHVARYERAVKAERGGEVEAEVAIDGRLVELVERMMESAMAKRAYTLVMGIAIESRQLAAVERLVRLCGTAPGDGEHEGGVSPMLEYVFSLAMAAPSRDFRHKLVAVLAKVYRSLATPDFVGLSRCLAHLNDAKAVTELLERLIRGTRDEKLVAQQVTRARRGRSARPRPHCPRSPPLPRAPAHRARTAPRAPPRARRPPPPPTPAAPPPRPAPLTPPPRRPLRCASTCTRTARNSSSSRSSSSSSTRRRRRRRPRRRRRSGGGGADGGGGRPRGRGARGALQGARVAAHGAVGRDADRPQPRVPLPLEPHRPVDPHRDEEGSRLPARPRRRRPLPPPAAALAPPLPQPPHPSPPPRPHPRRSSSATRCTTRASSSPTR